MQKTQIEAWPAAPPAEPFFQVGAAQTAFADTGEQARAQFAQFQAIHMRDVLEPALFASVLRLSAAARFEAGDRVHAPGFREVEAAPKTVGKVLNTALNRPELLRWLEQVSGWPVLDTLAGRVCQTLNRPGDELLWHNDLAMTPNRRLAVVFNLSTNPYTGGDFHLRRVSGEPLFGHRYTEPNSAIIFKVHPELCHRVLPLSAGGPRRVYAGWVYEGEVQ